MGAASEAGGEAMALMAPTANRVELRPIAERDVDSVAEFLHEHLNERVPPAAWSRALDVPWRVDRPNAGFMLVAGGAVVGAQLAIYSERIVDGRPERFCNLGALCVLEQYRFHTIRLLKAVLAQDDYHFSDLSPSGNVVAVNERLGFSFLDTTTALMPNLPLAGRGRISSDPAVIERTLRGHELELYRDHARTAAARHLVLIRDSEHCYVIFRKDRRKGLPLFASVLYTSNPDLFRRMAGQVGRHILLRHGVAATLLERAVLEHPPRLCFTVPSPRRKMFRSASLEAHQIDYLYSELVCLSW
jgi:hypothetical protein